METIKRFIWRAALFCSSSLLLLVGFAASLALLVLIYLMFIRAGYPYELEWIEGAGIDQIRWILQGNPLYGPPSLAFIPMTYNPVYFYISAGLSHLVGLGFLAPRLLSILASFGILFLLAAIAVQDSRAPGWKKLYIGGIAAGIFAASYRFTGAWLDLVKTDSLFLFWILAGFYSSVKWPGKRGIYLSTIFYLLAYYTKQLALVILIGLCVSSLLASRGREWLRWVLLAVLGGGIFLALNLISDGWYSFYTVDIIATHGRNSDYLYFWRMILLNMGPAFLVGSLYLIEGILKGGLLNVFRFRASETPKKTTDFTYQNLSLAASLILASWSVFFKSWTYDNGYIPAVAGLALFAALGLDRVLYSLDFPRNPLIKISIKSFVLLLLLLQFARLTYDPRLQVPSDADRRSAQQFVSRLHSLEGSVWVYSHGYYNYLAGKTGYFHSAPFGDVIGGVYPAGRESDRKRISQTLEMFQDAVRQQEFNWVVVDKDPDSWLPYYYPVEKLASVSDDFYPVTGAKGRPEYLLQANPYLKGGRITLGDLNPDWPKIGWIHDQAGWRGEDNSELRVALENGAYTIVLSIIPDCTDLQPGFQSISLRWNNTSLGVFPLNGCGPIKITADVGEENINKGWNNIIFQLEGRLHENKNPGFYLDNLQIISH